MSGMTQFEQVPHTGVLDDDSRRIAGAAVAAVAIGWWPAFTLGVYGVVFFEQHVTLWAVSTTAFLALGLTRGVHVWRSKRVLVLLLPSLWLLLAWLLPVGGTSTAYQALYWIGVVVTMLGLPALGAFLVRLLIPGAGRLRGREALAIGAVVVLVMVISFGLGTQHPRFLTCEDFTISGKFPPENCTDGTGSTVR